MRDLGIKRLGAGCPNLVHVNLSGCKLLSDAGVIPMVQSCPRIQILNLTRIANVTDACIESVAHCLPELRELYLYADSQLSDKAFQHLSHPQSSKCSAFEVSTRMDMRTNLLIVVCNKGVVRKLEKIDLCGCQRLSDQSLIQLCLNNQNSLVSLNLTWCLEITDRGIQEGVAVLDSLDLLSMFGNTIITQATLDSLVGSHGRGTSSKVKTLDLNGCSGISAENRSQEALSELFPHCEVFVYHS